MLALVSFVYSTFFGGCSLWALLNSLGLANLWPRKMAPIKQPRKRVPNPRRKPKNRFPTADSLLPSDEPAPSRESVIWLVNWISRRAATLLKPHLNELGPDEDLMAKLSAYDTQCLAHLVRLVSEFEAGFTLFKSGPNSVRLIDIRLEAARKKLAVVFRAEKALAASRARTNEAITDEEFARRLTAFDEVQLVLDADQQRVIRNFNIKKEKGSHARDAEEAAAELVALISRMLGGSVRKRLGELPAEAIEWLSRRGEKPPSENMIEFFSRDVLGFDNLTTDDIVEAARAAALNRAVVAAKQHP